MSDYKTNGCDSLCCKGYSRLDSQLHVYDWLYDVPGNLQETDFVEVQFKNTRKGYYLNSNHLSLEKGDVVAVEASPGHDVGTVTLTGGLVLLQMKKANLKDDAPVRRVYRKARPVDMEKYEEAKAREHTTMIESRQIAKDLGLEMKIGDVEYQGDGGKAIFYYIADGRVDFRQLIKVLAETFHVRIEMKQIGARQEAGRIGGFGPCGRELCCSTWMSTFNSVSTGAARIQDLSLNPQKLAGQCAKLKCCMNYEVDCYAEAARQFPARDIKLETTDGTWHFFKSDILARQVTYSSDKNMAANLVTISTRRAFDIIRMNREGQKPEELSEEGISTDNRPGDLLEQDSLTRFDRAKKRKKKSSNRPAVNRDAAPDGQEKREGSSERREGGREKREGSSERREGGREKREGSPERREGGREKREGNSERREGGREKREGNSERREGGREKREGTRHDNPRRDSRTDVHGKDSRPDTPKQDTPKQDTPASGA